MILNRETLKLSFHQITFISLLTLSSTLCFAGIYKWVDAEGNTHYGQQRPADAQSESMNVQMHAPVNQSTYQKSGAEKSDDQTGTQEDGAEQKQETTAKPEEKKETSAEKQRRLATCAKARKSLAAMSSQGRVRSKDKDGNITYLSQQQKDAKIKKHKNLVAKHCK
ncbi:MAG: hypothetical protein DIZ80_14300 [endosymbiont of Galathealinum brachiosum]|uniref:DUF4124 domain-containing protein n=1 Tax=endosymbiont of Galathealinum brachiosum TaxID=2200906 RepID=A0A370D8Q5_9GAMM|nr:MAG: hypothetical protein DIZ80_14300 [endosymbiont of Galathealinum brachiosum]